jgi:hypothetical protein
LYITIVTAVRNRKALMRQGRLICGVALAAVLGAGTVQGQTIPAGVHPVPAIVSSLPFAGRATGWRSVSLDDRGIVGRSRWISRSVGLG